MVTFYAVGKIQQTTLSRLPRNVVHFTGQGLHLLDSISRIRNKWNESGFRPPLCTYRLNWARRTSWGWWDDWDNTVLQTQDSKFEPWRSEAEHATSRSRRLPTILTFTRGWGRNNFVSFKPPRPGTEPRSLAWKAAVLTTTLGPPPIKNQIHDSFPKKIDIPQVSKQFSKKTTSLDWNKRFSNDFNFFSNKHFEYFYFYFT